MTSTWHNIYQSVSIWHQNDINITSTWYQHEITTTTESELNLSYLGLNWPTLGHNLISPWWQTNMTFTFERSKKEMKRRLTSLDHGLCIQEHIKSTVSKRSVYFYFTSIATSLVPCSNSQTDTDQTDHNIWAQMGQIRGFFFFRSD